MLLSFIARPGLMVMFQGKLKTLYFMDITVSILAFFFFFFLIIKPLSEVTKFLENILGYPFLVKCESYTWYPSKNIYLQDCPPINANILK